MKKNTKWIGGVVIVVVAGVIGWRALSGSQTDKQKKDTTSSGYEYYYNDDNQPEDKVGTASASPKATAAPLIEVDTDPESITVLVNREYLLPEEYVPADLVVPDVTFSFYGTYEKSYMREAAASALEKLFAGAKEQGISLKGVSAYRSYSRQKEIYNRNVNTKGKKKANQVSALPGSSEHQTGLTIDVSASSVGCSLEESFGDTNEGKWLAKNCYKYGFIIRYPKGKEAITGYSYEPWHIRYVGKNLAKRLYKKKLTLEEYYQTTTVDNKVKPDQQVKDTDVNAPDDAQMTSAPTPNPSYKAKPKKTMTPEPSPTKTPKAKATKKPTKTPKPHKTKKPQKTKKPKVTKAPAKTPKPVVTKTPEAATKAPEKTPEPTKAPENGADTPTDGNE